MPAKTCVVTGGSRGIGLATALRFAAGGYNVVINGRDPGRLQAAADQIAARGAACEAVPCDIGTLDGATELVDVAVKRFGGIDVLVNNAGAAPLSAIDSMSTEDFRRTIDVNVAGVFYATRAAWSIMRDGGGGTIVNISSVASIDPFPGFSVYGASKAWVNLFTKAIAVEGKPLGIRVFAVAPGAVETDLLRANVPDFPAEQALRPDEVAAVIETLCDSRMDHCVRQTIFVQR